MIRTLPTTMVTGYWDKDSTSKIPERVKIVLADGTKASYALDVAQPHPQCQKAIEIVRNMDIRGYFPKHNKKGPADAATSDRPVKK